MDDVGILGSVAWLFYTLLFLLELFCCAGYEVQPRKFQLMCARSVLPAVEQKLILRA